MKLQLRQSDNDIMGTYISATIYTYYIYEDCLFMRHCDLYYYLIFISPFNFNVVFNI